MYLLLWILKPLGAPRRNKPQLMRLECLETREHQMSNVSFGGARTSLREKDQDKGNQTQHYTCNSSYSGGGDGRMVV
jgi:hypothetical protein